MIAEDYWYLTSLATDTPIDRRLITNQALQQAVGDGFLTSTEVNEAVVDVKLYGDRLAIKIRRSDDAGS